MLRAFLEFLLTARGAEVEPLPIELGHMRRAGAVHRHATDRIGRFDIGFGLGHECLAAPFGAEVIDMAIVIYLRLSDRGIDGHATDRIAGHIRCCMVLVVRVMVVRCHGSLLIVLDFDLAFSDRASSNWRVKWAFPVFQSNSDA